MSIDQSEVDQTEGDQTEGDQADAAAPAPEEGEGGAGGGEDPPAPPPELEAGPAPPDPVRDRLLLPLLLPILAIVAVALYVLNISRVFLAGGNGAPSVIVAGIVTVGILVGAAVISAMPQLRSSTLTTTLALLFAIVMGAGLITLGPSEPHEEGGEGGYQEPAGAPTSNLAVEALPSVDFQADEFSVPGGILEITYVQESPNHSLVFEEDEFSGFRLAVPQGPKKGKVEIREGEYTIYCDIPGHRAQGMEALLTITPPPPGSEGAPGEEGGPPSTEAP
jgi:plastocyanin